MWTDSDGQVRRELPETIVGENSHCGIAGATIMVAFIGFFFTMVAKTSVAIGIGWHGVCLETVRFA